MAIEASNTTTTTVVAANVRYSLMLLMAAGVRSGQLSLQRAQYTPGPPATWLDDPTPTAVIK